MNGETRKVVERPGFTNSVVFGLVMRRNPAICREVIETALGFGISEISFVDAEQTIQPSVTARSVRLDVVARSSGKVFDVEMQVASEPAMARRARYYQAAMDTDILKRGIGYEKLPESYVIFICKGRPYGDRCAQRRFSMMDIASSGDALAFGDGRTVVVLSAGNWAQASSPELSGLLQYVHTGVAPLEGCGLPARIDAAVEAFREDDANMGYMTLAEQMDILERYKAEQSELIAEQSQRIVEQNQRITEQSQLIERDSSIRDLAAKLIAEGRGEEYVAALADDALMDKLLAENA